MKRETFFEKYKDCGSVHGLNVIWDAYVQSKTQIYLQNTQIYDLTPLVHLSNLQTLFCSNTAISDLDPLSEVKNLQTLFCANTQISSLSPLSNLKNLNSIFCSSTQVSNLTPLSKMHNIRWLDCSNTKVEDLAPLSDLPNLQIIDCSNSEVSDLSSLSRLKGLQKLFCHNTRVADLSPIAHLADLQTIDCSDTLISDLAPLSLLKKLQILYCFNTSIEDLTPLANLRNLKQLNCSNTQISNLRPLKLLFEARKIAISGSNTSLNFGQKLQIDNCPISNPPIEIAQQGTEAILRYWEEQERSGLQKINEARLLIVGQGGAGKTTLKDKLKDPNAPMPAPDATTKGIEIHPYVFKNALNEDFTLQLWDFGGQNIQHYAHQFFMSDSAVYALLSNEREQNPNFQYWLNIIELLGKESPVVIVRNEKDGHCEPLKNAAQIQERFQGICNIQSVDLSRAASDPRFETIKTQLLGEAQRLPHVQKQYPGSFKNIRVKLQALADRQSSITYQEFKNLCKEEGIENQDLMADYARTFTILGIALHFGDDVHLKKTVFLRPKWIIDALFQLLYHEKVEKQRGRFAEKDAEAIWHQAEYEAYHGDLLRLMERFELCFQIESTKAYIVPQRLPERTVLFEQAGATQVLYRYKFMPKGMLTRLTCRLHQRIDQDQVWSDAVQFSDKSGNARVFVREIYNEHCIELNAFGEQREELLNLVIDTLDGIHGSSQLINLQVEKLVPCACKTCQSGISRNEAPHFFKYEFLLKMLSKGKYLIVHCENSADEVMVMDILNHSGVRAFKIQEIENLILLDEIQRALSLLRGFYEENDEIILQMNRLSLLENEARIGTLARSKYDMEKNHIRAAIMQILRKT